MTPTSTVSATAPAAAAPAAAAPAAAAAAPGVDAAALQTQIDELREQVAEGQRTAQYWADKARTAAPAPAAAATDDEPDVLEAITTGGAKGFDALAEKRGFIKRGEVEALINDRATTLTKEQQLISDYPDLKNKKSEFFLATAANYGRLVTDGMPQKLAMEQAARATELEFIRTGKIKLPSAVAEETAAKKESDRLARIAAQSGTSGRRSAAPAEGEDDEELTPEQKHLCAAMGITEEAYKKRAKAGVAMKGLG